MPILDDIRRNQIAEAMNYDRTMYMKAFQLTKRAVNVMDPEPAPENEPYVQVNPEDTQAAEELVNNLLLLLEQKRNAIDSLTRGQGNADSISVVEDVLTSYNTLVNLLINPKATPQTRSALLTSVLKIEKYVVDIEELCEKVLNGLLRLPRNPQAITFYFMKVLKAYNAYNLIHKQIRSNNFVISNPARSRQDNMELVLRRHGAWLRAKTRQPLKRIRPTIP
jgi:hypothetical protein